mmetsp:Transcript_5608/g.8709  ORF Transcript_5608/g.8709 Transcript_5608/m.8709 type:complete len:316 (-) Transcript_5608:37-984(-)
MMRNVGLIKCLSAGDVVLGAKRLQVQARCIGSVNGLVQKGVVSDRLTVPGHIERPPYADDGVDPGSSKTVSQFDLNGQALVKMRDACKHSRDTLEYAGELVKPGVTTDYIDRMVHEHVVKRNVFPSPLNYMGFPKSLCSSVNEVICHGIPDDRVLLEGDIVNLDVSTYTGGHHGDTSATFKVGEVSEIANKLTDTTQDCLMQCIELCGPGVPLASVGDKVQDICNSQGFEVNRTFCGHGIGATFHMLPYVLHFPNNMPFVLAPGHVFTIEPVLCEGSQEHQMWNDGWTVATRDGSLSAQFEHTLLVTEHGVEILT